MAFETNVVALIEDDFLKTARSLMSDRQKAFGLYEWALKSMREGQHTHNVEQLFGELINEVFALNTQLNGRSEKQESAA